MSFEPEKFFIGVIDFFAILMPGALLAYLGKGYLSFFVLNRPDLPLKDPESFMIFLFIAYLLGHITFLLGSLLDQPYDWLRSCTDLGQIRRLAESKNLSNRWMRGMASWLFSRNADAALVQTIRIKSRALRGISAGNVVNAYQWCKASLSKNHPQGLVAVQRFEADSKFFRSFAIVLLALTVISLSQPRGQRTLALSAACVGLLLPTLWRYIDQRFKATQQAYWFVLTLESIKDHSDNDRASKLNSSGLTHSGGVVFRRNKNIFEFLLVQASSNRNELVLPKGHIELGESEREAAVREVREETGYWARVVDWISEVRLGDGPDAPMVRFFLMELVMEEEVEWPPENRQHLWLSLDDSKQQDLHKETMLLLENAASAASLVYQKAAATPTL